MEEEYISINKDKFTLNKFLEDFSLLIGNEEETEDSKTKNDKVKLMTIHQAKGLEFKYIFIVGLEEGYYPCGSYIKDIEELEEERRIFYVAITRAKINCYLSYAKERLYDGEFKKRNKSCFLSEIYNPEFIQTYDLDNEQNYKNSVINFSSGNFKHLNKKKYDENKNNNNNEIKYNFIQKINLTKNTLSIKENNFWNNSNKTEKLNNKIIDIDENENFENILNETILNKKLNGNLINNKTNKINNEIDKKEKTQKEKPKNTFINKKKYRFKIIESFLSSK